MQSRKTPSRTQIISTIVLIGTVVCMIIWGVILTTHIEIFTSRWLLDWLLFALPIWFFLSLLGVTKQKKTEVSYFFLIGGCIILFLAVFSEYISVRTPVITLFWCSTGWYMYRRQRQRLLSRRRRSARWYIVSQVALWWSCVSFLTTLSIISTIGDTWINCKQLESSLRLSWIQQQVTISSLGGFLWAAKTTSPAESNNGTQQGMLWILSTAKSEIYDLIVEQKDLLNHGLCELINQQLITIQQRPWRQLAGILLLYILIRPLISILVWICMPLWILIWNMLVRSNLIKKEKKWVMITWLALK